MHSIKLIFHLPKTTDIIVLNGGIEMVVNYKPLWKQLIDKNMMKTEFAKVVGISSNLLANMGKNEYISMKNLEKICKVLECTPNDIIEFEFDFSEKDK